jgi:type IV secretory pathway VirB10-like protein
MSDELTHPSALLGHVGEEPTASDVPTEGEGTKTQGTFASKIPADHPGLKLERALPRALRRGPLLVAAGILFAAVGVALVVALSPRDNDHAKANAEPSTESGQKQIQISEAVKNVPGNDAPLRQAQAPVPRLGPPVRGDGRQDPPGGSAGVATASGDGETRRQAAREERQKALASPILVELENPTATDQGSATSTTPSPNGMPGATPAAASAQIPGALGSSADPNMQQRKNDFLSHDGVNSSSYLSELPTAPRSPYEVKAGTVIPTTLITGIDSDLPGQIVGQVRENVYDTVTGNYLVIPQGSRLIATYDSMVGFGQERVLVCWNRLIRPDGMSVGLECMPGVDLSGYAGFADDVDHHWWRILSGVALGTLLSATAQRSQGDVTGFQPTFPQLWASNAAGSINSAGQAITQKNLQIQPTIKIRPGFTVNVLVSKDIIITPFVRPRFAP